ncbi:UDP-N-acetylmuramate dehydrogenase [Arenibaculum sp.]|uniref:UDP-N-acetylmuramate dehydrogenase n=1 Tax=Arenibaculum sp. TaxID=2865862 RepID=UPI002E0DC2F2|nr:UDP-N-acetylmuramate dehydrogenase [Arenibaculum sp.]
MAARVEGRHLIDRLPAVRGRLSADASLASTTWFRVGGPAEALFRPADEEDLAQFLAGCPDDVPVTVIGVASNLLVRDGGVPGVVIRLGRGFAEVAAEGRRVTAGSGALDLNAALAARDAGIGGLEFLSGIPGTIGGALRMNAGAYGRETADVLVEATALDRAGTRHRLAPAELGFGYRHCGVPADWIFTGAVFEGEPAEPAGIAARIDDIARARAESQPVRARTGGSTFANPAGHKAWELIDRAGCRGLAIGGAQVSEKHCNFLINTGEASAADLETLGEEVRRRVLDMSGITLEWEIRRIGVARRPAEETAP